MEGFEKLKKLIHCDNYLTESDGPGALLYIEINNILISRVFFFTNFLLGMNIILISRVFFFTGACISKPGCVAELRNSGKNSVICDGVVDCPVNKKPFDFRFNRKWQLMDFRFNRISAK